MTAFFKLHNIIAASLICLCLNASAQSNIFVQFRIVTPLDQQMAAEVDKKMSGKDGVLESRTDFVTGTYFCLLNPESTFTKENFVAWFTKMGLEIACYTKGIQGTDATISPHVLKTCTDEKTE